MKEVTLIEAMEEALSMQERIKQHVDANIANESTDQLRDAIASGCAMNIPDETTKVAMMTILADAMTHMATAVACAYRLEVLSSGDPEEVDMKQIFKTLETMVSAVEQFPHIMVVIASAVGLSDAQKRAASMKMRRDLNSDGADDE